MTNLWHIHDLSFFHSSNLIVVFMLFVVDGGYTEWGSWSVCSVTCGSGMISRRRECINPRPANNGSDCLGLPEEIHYCTAPELCPGLMFVACSFSCSFIFSIQCFCLYLLVCLFIHLIVYLLFSSLFTQLLTCLLVCSMFVCLSAQLCSIHSLSLRRSWFYPVDIVVCM